MKLTRIPNTDLTPSVIALGATSIGSAIDEKLSWRMLDAYVAGGGNMIDTAKVYADWLPGERSVSENTIGRWLRASGKRDQVIVSTKGAHPDLATMHVARLSPKEIVGDLDASLKHLRVAEIDLYWLHRDDPKRPVEEIIEAMQRQVQAGKIRWYGCSNWKTQRIIAAQAYAHRRGWSGFVANQMLWSLAAVDDGNLPDRTAAAMNQEMWRYHVETGMSAIPYSSQANGYFHRILNSSTDGLSQNAQRLYARQENVRRANVVKRISEERAISITGVVLGYLLSQPFVTIPIIGPRTIDQLADSIAGAEVRLTADDIAQLERGEDGNL